MQADAFAPERALGQAGNPAGVCLLDEEQPLERLQSVAIELKQAETAFVRPTSAGQAFEQARCALHAWGWLLATLI